MKGFKKFLKNEATKISEVQKLATEYGNLEIGHFFIFRGPVTTAVSNLQKALKALSLEKEFDKKMILLEARLHEASVKGMNLLKCEWKLLYHGKYNSLTIELFWKSKKTGEMKSHIVKAHEFD